MILEDLTDTVAFCDPAGSKRNQPVKRVRSRMAIVVVGQDILSRVFVLHTWADRCSADTLMERILDISKAWRPRPFGIEANGLQSLFADCMQREAQRQNVLLALRPITQPTNVTKQFRIRSILQPVIGSGRLLVQPSQIELEAELKSFPMGRTSDIVDALASAVDLLPRRSSGVQKRDCSADRIQYLRDTRAPEWYVQKVERSN